MSVHMGVLVAHIVSAAITVGATLSYAVWIALAERQPEHLAFTIGAVRRSDRLVAIPSFVVAGITGTWLVLATALPFARLWLGASLAIYAVVLVVGFTVFGPVVRRELAALEQGGVSGAEYLRLRDQARLLSYGTIAALLAILWLMVAKPV